MRKIAQQAALCLFCFNWCIARSIRLMASSPSLLISQCTSSTELSPSIQMDMDLRMTWKGREKKKETQAPPFIRPLLPLFTVFHQTILHLYMTVVLIGVSALCFSFPPSLLLSATVLTWSFTYSLLSLHLRYYWRPQQTEWERKKEREGGKEKLLVTRQHTGLNPLNRAIGGNVQCTDGERVQGDWTRVCSPFYPRSAKACSYYLFWESYICKLILTCLLTHSFCHNCYHTY